MISKLKELMNKITKAGLLHFVRNDNTRKKVAFTLAEVLITLGIIGVVAAMTIPNLYNTYQKAVFKAQLKKTDAYVHQLYQELYNEGLIPLANASLLAGHGGLTKMTNTNKCADNTKYKSMGGTHGTGSDFLSNGFCLKDGRPLFLYGSGSDLLFFVDINGYNKGPNFLGVDLFAWEYSKYTPNGLKPMGAPGTKDTIIYAKYKGPCPRRCTYDRTCGRACTYKALNDPNYFDDWKWKFRR